MDALVSQLITTVIELVQNYHVTHEDINTKIIEALTTMSEKLPKVKVLLNGVHGRYGYSAQFKQFIKNDGHIPHSHCGKHSRITHVLKVIEFGIICKQRFPFAAKLIAIYNEYNLCDVMRFLHNVHLARKDLDKLKAAYETVLVADNALFGTLCDAPHFPWVDCSLDKLTRYNKQFLLQWLQNKIQVLENTVQEYCDKIQALIGLDRCNWLMNNNNFRIEEVQFYESRYHMDRWNSHVWFTFLDALEHYGEKDFAVWKCQRHYSEFVMRFLFKHHDMFDVMTLNHCTDIEMGLVCASGPFCKLCVFNAPQIVSWYIGDYDGLETIIVNPFFGY